MSHARTAEGTDRGRPVLLTNGERRLLVGLLRDEIGRLGGRPSLSESTGPVREAARIARLRVRQYRRLIHELEREDAS